MKNPDSWSPGRVVDTFGHGDEKRSRVQFQLRFGETPARLTVVVDTSDLDMRSDKHEARKRARNKLDVPAPNPPPSLR